MSKVDHLFVFCRMGAPERERLLQRGLRVGATRRHHGQGTENVCFGFADCYLELLWLADEQEARDPVVKPLGLHERMRWRDTRSSPFGVAVRPATRGAAPPFPSWDYRPAYLPAAMRIDMACNSGVIGEPLLFQVDREPDRIAEQHAWSDARLARVRITTPDLAPMSLLREPVAGQLVFAEGDEHLLELEFESGRGEVLDLRPELPIVLRR